MAESGRVEVVVAKFDADNYSLEQLKNLSNVMFTMLQDGNVSDDDKIQVWAIWSALIEFKGTNEALQKLKNKLPDNKEVTDMWEDSQKMFKVAWYETCLDFLEIIKKYAQVIPPNKEMH